MISRFEEYTEKLSEQELELVPRFLTGLSVHKGAANVINNKSIRQQLQNIGVIVPDTRVRKLINHIRNNQLIKGLVASSKGYYVSNDLNDVISFRNSLLQRALYNIVVAHSFDDFIEELRESGQISDKIPLDDELMELVKSFHKVKYCDGNDINELRSYRDKMTEQARTLMQYATAANNRMKQLEQSQQLAKTG
jgi:hypothetical protein